MGQPEKRVPMDHVLTVEFVIASDGFGWTVSVGGKRVTDCFGFSSVQGAKDGLCEYLMDATAEFTEELRKARWNKREAKP